jgi:hypothetical protein
MVHKHMTSVHNFLEIVRHKGSKNVLSTQTGIRHGKKKIRRSDPNFVEFFISSIMCACEHNAKSQGISCVNHTIHVRTLHDNKYEKHKSLLQTDSCTESDPIGGSCWQSVRLDWIACVTRVREVVGLYMPPVNTRTLRHLRDTITPPGPVKLEKEVNGHYASSLGLQGHDTRQEAGTRRWHSSSAGKYSQES